MEYFNSFEVVENEIREQTPEIIYKFRDWKNPNHKRILTEKEIWFAHPKTLNDPYDARPPYNFIAENIDWEMAKIKMKEAGKMIEPRLTEDELEKEVEMKLIEFKHDPIKYFTDNMIDFNSDENNFDGVGIFSCCNSYGNEAMWAHYGNNHKGFAVGFNTIELHKALKCSLGLVNYSDTPIDYYILDDNKGNPPTEILQKSKKWSYEEEIRYYTYGINITRTRSINYPKDALKEIVFGINTDKETVKDISKIIMEHFPGVSLYKLALNPSGYGFLKSKIS